MWVMGIISLFLLLFMIRLCCEINQIKDQLQNYNKGKSEKKITNTVIFAPITGLSREINKSIQLQKELKLDSQRQEKRLKDSIIGVSHDLRTPLTVLQGYLEMMEVTNDSEKKRQYLRLTQNKAGQLNEIVNSFYELSMIEGYENRFDMELFDLTELLINCVIDCSSLLKKRYLEPDLDIPQKPYIIESDPNVCRRIIENLLSNAWRYTTGEIRIEMYEKKNWYVLQVSNRADHLRQKDMQHLFEKFYQHDKSRQSAGSGIGLYIVKILADQLGIKIISKLDDGWLSIGLEFPVCRNSYMKEVK